MAAATNEASVKQILHPRGIVTDSFSTITNFGKPRGVSWVGAAENISKEWRGDIAGKHPDLEGHGPF